MKVNIGDGKCDLENESFKSKTQLLVGDINN